MKSFFFSRRNEDDRSNGVKSCLLGQTAYMHAGMLPPPPLLQSVGRHRSVPAVSSQPCPLQYIPWAQVRSSNKQLNSGTAYAFLVRPVAPTMPPPPLNGCGVFRAAPPSKKPDRSELLCRTRCGKGGLLTNTTTYYRMFTWARNTRKLRGRVLLL